MLVFRIPENLDIKKIIKKNRIAFCGKNLKEDKLLFICDAIIKSRAQSRKQLNEEGHQFAPLSSEILQEVLYDYPIYLQFLLANRVIQTDNRFIRGEKCKGYCFNYPYAGRRLKEVTVYNYTLKKAIRRANEKRNNEIKKAIWGYSYLTRWWHSDKLKIDQEAANLWISEYEKEKKCSIYLNDKIVKKEKAIKIAIETTEDFKVLVDSINNKPPRYGFSGEGHRFYNPICNLKRELRNFLSYDGKNLVDADVKNCQPFLTTALFKASFWEEPVKNNGQNLCLKNLNKEIYNKVRSSTYYKAIITLLKNAEALTEKESTFKKYTDFVVKGGFYEYIHEHFQPLYPVRFDDRKKVKCEVLRIFYVENRKINWEFYKPCKIFQAHFPEVFELFRLIKEIQSNYLAIILQRIESFLILDVVCKSISSQHPQIPIFTIHDNIITTQGNEGIIRAVMSQEIEKWIGYEPQVSTTELNPEFLKAEI